MVRIEFYGQASDVLAEMRAMLAPIAPHPPEEAFRLNVAAAAELDNFEAFETATREPELPLEPPAPVPVAAPEAAPRKRRTKAEMEAARAAEAAAAAAGAAHEVPAPADTIAEQDAAADLYAKANTPIDFESVKNALKEVCEAEGLGVLAAQKLLADFGVARLSLLDAAKWPEFYNAARALLDGDMCQ